VAASPALSARRGYSAAMAGGLRAGEGVVETTRPLGIEMGGFHRRPNNPRVITGIREPTAARVLVLACGDTQVAVVSLDVLDVSWCPTR
jgi:hypothetical protein